MSTSLERYASLVGRILIGGIFLVSGVLKIPHWSAEAAQMTAHGMPAVPLFLGAATAIEILGGLALVLGWQTRTAALVLFLYLIPVTVVMHNFWAAPADKQQEQFFSFLKNAAILGGLLEFYAVGGGALSLDARLPQSSRWVRPAWPGFRRTI